MSVHRKIEKGMRKSYAAVAQPQADNHIPAASCSSLAEANSEGKKFPAKPYRDVDSKESAAE